MKLKDALIFLFGAAVGVGIFWLLASEDGKKVMSDLKTKFGQGLKDLGVDPDELNKILSEEETEPKA